MKLKQSLVVAGIAALMCLPLMAQQDQGGGGGGGRRRGNGGGGGFGGGGNFDPAQFQQQRMDQIHEEMGVTDDSEWKAIQDRLQKVMDAQTAARPYQNTGFGGRGRNRGGGGGGGGGFGGGGGGRGGFQPSPELEALRNAIENNAPAEQIKAALEKFRTARKAKEDALVKAQDELKKVLSVKQEAVAVTNGYLN